MQKKNIYVQILQLKPFHSAEKLNESEEHQFTHCQKPMVMEFTPFESAQTGYRE